MVFDRFWFSSEKESRWKNKKSRLKKEVTEVTKEL